jgi:hypothetical protein
MDVLTDRQAHRPSRLINVSSKMHELGRLRNCGSDGGGGGGPAGSVRDGPLARRRAWAAQAYSDSKLAQVVTHLLWGSLRGCSAA